MQPERLPTLSAVLTAVGGALILAGGLLLWRVGTVLAQVFGLPSPLFFGGVVLGLVTMAIGVALEFAPAARRPLGVAALACAAVSLPLAFGGFVIGFGLAAVGGAIALSRPRRPVPVVSPASSGPSPPWT